MVSSKSEFHPAAVASASERLIPWCLTEGLPGYAPSQSVSSPSGAAGGLRGCEFESFC